jgi:hypothetical protein
VQSTAWSIHRACGRRLACLRDSHGRLQYCVLGLQHDGTSPGRAYHRTLCLLVGRDDVYVCCALFGWCHRMLGHRPGWLPSPASCRCICVGVDGHFCGVWRAAGRSRLDVLGLSVVRTHSCLLFDAVLSHVVPNGWTSWITGNVSAVPCRYASNAQMAGAFTMTTTSTGVGCALRASDGKLQCACFIKLVA